MLQPLPSASHTSGASDRLKAEPRPQRRWLRQLHRALEIKLRLLPQWYPNLPLRPMCCAAMGLSRPSMRRSLGKPVMRLSPVRLRQALLRNDEPQDGAIADQSGQFVMVPPRLPPGDYELTLRSTQSDGKQESSQQGVAVSLHPSLKDQLDALLVAPDRRNVALSEPAVHLPLATRRELENTSANSRAAPRITRALYVSKVVTPCLFYLSKILGGYA